MERRAAMNAIINQVLQGLIVIALDITLWSGRKKLRPEDLGGVALPPDKLASLGSKRIYDPDSLCIFATLKRQAERACSEVGVRFLGGYAVPETKLDDLYVELERIQTAFEKAKTHFLSSYDSKLADWLEEAGEWREIVARAVEPGSAIVSKLACGFTAYKVGMPEDIKAVATIEKQIGGLADQLIREVSKAALDAYEDSFKGRTEVTRKALRPLKAIQDKLTGLAFVAPEKISGITTNVEAALNAVPKTGPIEGAVLMGLVGALTELADIDGFVAAAEKAEAEAPVLPAAEAKKKQAPKARTPKAPRPEPDAVPEEKPESEIPVMPEIEMVPEQIEQPEAWFW